MPTRNVVLTDHQEELIAALVESGTFQNASEVLRAGLRLLEREQKEHEEKLQALRAAVQAGFADIEADNYIDLATEADRKAFWDGVRAEVAERAAKRDHRTG